MIHDELVTYEVAKLAKEKGFPQQYDSLTHIYGGKDSFNVGIDLKYKKCEGTLFDISKWNPCLNDIAAPTQSLLQRWLREEKGIIVEVFMDDDSNMPLTYNIHQYKDWNWECVCHHHGNYYAVTDWELCLKDALKYALEKLI